MEDGVADGAGAVSRGEQVALVGLAAFVVLALAGYGTFGRHPGLLAGLPGWASGFYGSSFAVFAQAQVWIAGGVLAYVLVRRTGVSWVWAFAVLYGTSLGAELAGTTWGIPFGAYRYGDALGVQWLGRVPVVIPLSWFCMAVPSYGLAGLVTGAGSRWPRAAVGSLVLLSWDLSLDPAMSHATRYWYWAESGPYYGMPLLNLAGWYVTGLALMTGLVVLRAGTWIDRLPLAWQAGFYGVNLLLPVGMNAIAGLGAAVAVALAVLVVFAGVAWTRRGSGPARPSVAGA